MVFFLDEFAQLGRMVAIEDAISLVRGYGALFWIFVQDLSQLKAVYERWNTFVANSAKQFFGTADYDTAKYVSDSMGHTTIQFLTANESQNQGSNHGFSGGSWSSGNSQGESQQMLGRPLLTPDEIMRLGSDQPLVLIQGEPPYRLNRLSYLTDPQYVGHYDASPYHV